MRVTLVYHRIAPRVQQRNELVPTVPDQLFREHLEALGDHGEIAPLEALLRDEGSDRIRFALTFDDDYSTHEQHVLPILTDLGLTATFFLSGRALHGLGAYWWERLEALVADRGAAQAARLLGLGDANETELPALCERDPGRHELIERHAPEGAAPLSVEGIRALVDGAMTVGFHTLRHPVLPTLSDDAVRRALTDGRDQLAAVVGAPLRWFAYPHGKADSRTAELVGVTGYEAAWTTEPVPLPPRVDADRHLLGRWEPQPIAVDDLLIRLASFLTRARST